jgi:hypothetical protein
MINILNQITGATKKSFRFLFFVFMLNSLINAQTESNLERFYSVVDSVSSMLLNDLGNSKQVKLELNLGTYYSVFANKIRGKLLKNDVNILSDDASGSDKINVNLVIDDCNVEYSQPERDGLFGDFFTERMVRVSGNYFISTNPSLTKFNIEKKDTIDVEDVEKVQNRSYPFTLGDLPAEPFFSSLWEPIVAVSAAAITIILFFSVRSK